MSSDLIIKVVVDQNRLDSLDNNDGKLQFLCPVTNCGRKFTSSVCLKTHFIKHHQTRGQHQIRVVTVYYCPVEKCQYNLDSEYATGKFFPAMKNLTQHYRKMHKPKILKCVNCEKAFSTETFRQQHLQTCGFIMVCNFCEQEYNSREALLTHISRKHSKHKEQAVKAKVKVQARPRPVKELRELKVRTTVVSSTQTDEEIQATVVTLPPPAKIPKLCSETQTTSCQHSDVIEDAIATILQEQPVEPVDTATLTTTDNAGTQTLNDYFDEYFKTNRFDTSGLCSIGSQTDAATSGNNNFTTNYDRADPMLYSQYTQTCDEIMDPIINPILKNMDEFDSEFGHIQTQTNWTGSDYNDDFLLVSTETQTSFSSCFLNNNHTQTSQSMEFLADIGSDEATSEEC